MTVEPAVTEAAVTEAALWVVRHGQTEWSRDGRHTGRTEVELTSDGELQAAALATFAAGLGEQRVLVSPRVRARRTAELAGLVPFEVVADLAEWDYGDLEGLTTAEIHENYPRWSIWDGPWPGGETSAEVGARADRVIERVRSGVDAKVIAVCHGHFGRVLAARWVGAPVSTGRWLELDTATWSQLGWDRGSPVVTHWNVPAARQGGDR